MTKQEQIEKEKWKQELRIERQKNKRKPNGFQYFSLGFSVCALIVSIIKLK